MPDHDQLLKRLLKTFFADFVHILRPELHAAAEFSGVRFDEQEMFTDTTEGTKHVADLVATVPLRTAGQSIILTHVEVEGKKQSRIGRRMYRYNLQLQLRSDLPVLPVVVFLKGGRPGITLQTHQVKVLEEVICEFRYIAFGLSQASAEEYLARPEPLAWALAALMRPSSSRVRLKLECLKRIVKSALNDLQKFLLANCVETYVELTGEEAREYRRLLEVEEKEVLAMQMTWEDKILARGEARGEGRLVKLLLTERFGPLPEELVERIESIQTPEELDRLALQVLKATSLEDLGLSH